MAERPDPAKKAFIAARHLARKQAVQALYQWALTGDDMGEVITQFKAAPDFARVDSEYFTDLLRGVAEEAERLDRTIHSVSERDPRLIDPVELGILRLAVYELTHRPDVPPKVVVNEAVNLAKTFGAEGSYRFVNSVLDRLLKQAPSPALG